LGTGTGILIEFRSHASKASDARHAILGADEVLARHKIWNSGEV
jgi:hypothetical protein